MKGGKNGIFHKMNASTALTYTVMINLFFNIPLFDSSKAKFLYVKLLAIWNAVSHLYKA